VGKREMYIPYNNNALVTAKVDEAFAKFHLNPDKLRWELHRVWEVEATVAPGKRRAVPKRRFYFDEDTWTLALMDGYDAEGKLWRPRRCSLRAALAARRGDQAGHGLQPAGQHMSTVQSLNDEQYRIVKRKPESYFTGDAVADDAAR
jgi:hypothetical protein